MMDEIKAALLNAIQRGESLSNAVASLINAGYNKDEVISVANEILLSKKSAPLMQEYPQNNYKEKNEEKMLLKLNAKPTNVIEKKEKLTGEEFPNIKKDVLKKEKKLMTSVKKIGLVKTWGRNLEKIYFFLSLVLIFYYLLILLIKYKNIITLIWILFGLPILIFSVLFLFLKKDFRNLNFFSLITSFIILMGFFIFNYVINKKIFFNVIRDLLLVPKYFYILEAYILSYIFYFIALFSKIKKFKK